jgi:Cu2+-exporting ATPase
MPARAADASMPDSGLKPAAACVHCGTQFRPTAARPDYCCAGCQFVHGLIRRNGLEKFYDLQDGGLLPVKSLVFQKRDYAWLEELAKSAEAAAPGAAALDLDLQGISCVGCVWLIEKLFLRKPGALSIDINTSLGQLHIRWKGGALDVVGFAQELQSFGYLVGPAGKAATPESSGLVKRLGLCAAFALNAMLFTLPGYLGMEQSFAYSALFNKLALLFGTLSFFIGGGYFFARTWHSLRHGVLHIDLPISLGLCAAYAGSIYAWRQGAMNFVYFDFVSIFVFLMLVGRWLQQTAIEKNRNRLLGMQTFIKQDTSGLLAGARYSVASGQIVPVRSKLLSDGATLGLEWINGESEARVARAGQLVSSGAVNLGRSPIECEAIEGWNDSILSKLLQIAPRNSFRHHNLERFIKIYILVVTGIAAAGFAAWLFTTGDLLKSLQVLTSILVVSCPCAAGVALPLAEELAVSSLRKLGVFVREQSLWVRINRVRKIIFDKTGTLTLETMALLNPEALDRLAPAQREALLQMTSDNLHPVSCCLRESLMAAGVAPSSGGDLTEIVGSGLEFRNASGVWRLGRPAWAVDRSYRTYKTYTTYESADAALSLNGDLLASFAFSEEARSDAAEEIAALRSLGKQVYILSGDRAGKVATMARRLGLPEDQCRGEMSPGDKAEWVRAMDDRDTLMIGDGANDSLAFNESYCNGTPAIDRGLLEQKADFYFLGRGLNGVRQLLEAGRRRKTTARRVIGFALSYNGATVLLCLAGKMSPLAASILMPASSLVSLGIVMLGRKR